MKINPSPLNVALFACVMAACTLTARAIPVNAITISVGNTFNPAGNSLGFKFSLSQSKDVVSLGVWDFGGDGLGESHSVGLWDSVGSLLASTTVAAGTGGILDNGFRFNNIGPVTLSAGTYTVAAVFTGNLDRVAYNNTIISAADVTYISSAYRTGTTFLAPNQFVLDNGYIGGNLRLDSASSSSAVPDTGSTLGVMGLALCGLMALRRKFAGA